jgi:protein-disulfide isomerase-like protein with CxxC motif
VRVDAWFDAICPWTWATSRWLVGCAAARGVEVRWHPYSLTFQNDSPVGPAVRALRVVAAVRAEDELAVGPLYTELGRRIHHDGEQADDDLAGALAAVGLARELAAAAGDESFDAAIRSSMAEAKALVGHEVGIPILALDDGDGPMGASGPILSAMPTGDEALQLFDAWVAALRVPGFAELKRSRTGPPPHPERP